MHFTRSSLVALAALSPVVQGQYLGYAETGARTLLKWYNQTSGIFDTTGWWNSANALTALVDLAEFDPVFRPQVQSVLSNTHGAAQTFKFNIAKFVSPEGLIETLSLPLDLQSAPKSDAALNGFLDGYYDDEGWWALMWVAAYDLTLDPTYLSTAESIFDDMVKAWPSPCGGGIWWDKAHTYVNAIANELFLSVASHLANRVPLKRNYYLGWAQKEWAWFKASGMINGGNTINDGLTNGTCKNNGLQVWTYNQGVVLGGLVELARAAPDLSYLDEAHTIANAAIKALAPSGVLHDPCEPNCGGDAGQFKGIFMRNLQILNQVAPQPNYIKFFQDNANSIWKNDRDPATDELSVVWSGPFVKPANASLQSSALDALVAAAAPP